MKISIIFLIIVVELFGAPAFSKLREFKNADGTTFKARGQGNHHLNWIQTQDGEILKYNSQTNNFEYAEIKNNRLKASGVRYEKNNSIRARSIGRVNKITKKDLQRIWLLQKKH